MKQNNIYTKVITEVQSNGIFTIKCYPSENSDGTFTPDIYRAKIAEDNLIIDNTKGKEGELLMSMNDNSDAELKEGVLFISPHESVNKYSRGGEDVAYLLYSNDNDKKSVLSNIGDTLFFNINPLINGFIAFKSFNDTLQGIINNTRDVKREFRISEDNIFWSEWKELSNNNLEGEYYTDNSMYIQIKYTRIGTDDTGEITFTYLELEGERKEKSFIAPTIISSIFSNIIGSECYKKIEKNLFKKLYFRGILPKYITRGENLNKKEDEDFIILFQSISSFFSLLMCFFKRYENFSNDSDMMKEQVRQLGLYFDEKEISIKELQYLAQHYLNEIRKRGTNQIFKRKEEETVDGEFLRLLRNKTSDELLYEKIPLNKVGWCLGECSPMYRGTSQAISLNKTKENTKDFQNLENFSFTASGVTLISDENKKVLNIIGSAQGNGLGGSDAQKIERNLCVIDSQIDYEITFAFKIIKDGGFLTFGVEGFDALKNKLNSAFIRSYGGTAFDNFINRFSLKYKRKDVWYYVRGIIHAYSSQNIDTKTNLNTGNNLYFNNFHTKYILPKILLYDEAEINIWDYKIRPLIRGKNIIPLKSGIYDNFSLGFIQSDRFFHVYAKNNNNNQSDEEITSIIDKYLLSYDSNNILTFTK